MKFVPIALQITIVPLFVSATEPPQSPHSGRSQMNDVRLETYKGFEKKWSLVTVRFRRDTNEMRFVYGNADALKGLNSGASDYPDGSVFAKIGVATADDPSFTSSAVPEGAKRFQLMVRDRRKYAATGGWGYALFDANGMTFGEDPKTATQACFACHQLVASRNYVFSNPMNLTTRQAAPRPPTASKNSPLSTLTFFVIARENLPLSVREALPPSNSRVQVVDGALRDRLFQGTLDEIRPVLAAKALGSGMAAALVSTDGRRFSLVVPRSGNPGCESHGNVGVSMTAIFTVGHQKEDKTYDITRMDLCVTK